jgi:crotonobetainyl-CoA:carnitine CoA-transferase CaiB-like acyl-CoA transferase
VRVGFNGVRVVDLSTGLSGAYATKMFADAGADVILVEDASGHPLRAWSASGADPGERDGALFRFLHHGKRSVVGATDQLIATADLIVDDGAVPRVDEEALRRRDPGLVVMSITPYGRTGPYAGRPATEFTVQAESGCLSVRGHRQRPPIMAGARIGEWVTGTVAATAAAGALYRARHTGEGEFIDVSMLELLNLAGTTCTDLMWSLFGRPSLEGLPPMRMLETPSIEPTSDGYVGFTTNSRQQFDDFLVLIERPDLLGDESLARVGGRLARFDEWNEIVWTWTKRHTTAEVLERASELRIPVAPVANGRTILDIDHFIDRRVFVEAPEGDFLLPRPPWRLNDEDPAAPRPSPRLGEHTGTIEPRVARRLVRTGKPALPLQGLRVLDLTAWWAGPAATHLLATLGADVVHVESPTRLDGMRMAGGADPSKPQWWERSAIFLTANTNKRGLAVDLATSAGLDVVRRLIARADIVLENFTPRVMDQFGLTGQAVHALNPAAIFVRMPAFGLTGPWRERTGFAQTMEQLTGLAWLTGYADDQPRIQRGPCDPNAGMHAAFAVLVALAEREATGAGQHLEVTMIEASLNAAAEQLVEYTAYGRLLERDGNRAPTAAPQNLYACRGTEHWLALSVADDAQWAALKQVLGSPAWADHAALATHAGRRAAHDFLDARLGEWAAGQDLEAAVAALIEAGVPAAGVYDARMTAFHPQLVARRFCEEPDHPVIGRHATTTLPFRYASVSQWLQRAAPTVGQHNHEVLAEAGYGDDEIALLEKQGVIGTWPAGVS